MSDEIKAARAWLTEHEPTWRVAIPEVRRTVLAALDALEREPELRAREARVRDEVERMRRAVEIMAGVESVAERVAQLRLVVARFDAALGQCPRCSGRGVVIEHRVLGLGTGTSNMGPCPDCHGMGTVKP